MDESGALSALSALANKNRLDVVRHLVKAGPDGLAAGEIAKAIGASPSQTSFHLSALQDGRLITVERQARRMVYRTNFGTFAALVGFIMEDCCGGGAFDAGCCPPD